MNKPALPIAVGLVLATGAAIAEENVRFEDLDTDGNGVIDPIEAEQHPGLAKAFDGVDGNRDGILDRLEFASAVVRMHQGAEGEKPS